MGFDFGTNWANFSRRALTAGRVAQARSDFRSLFKGLQLDNRTFLDIGFGQGLSLLSAVELGARVVGCDIDPTCADVLRHNAAFFPKTEIDDIPLVMGSILDGETQEKIRVLAKDGFDLVHAWGSLHHTGDMQRALCVSADFVAPGGHLVIAVYNQHWSSPLWRRIKWLFFRLPRTGQNLMVAALYPAIWAAKLAVTRKNPLRKERGMDFYYDIVDWVGGYPYEYATPQRVISQVEELGLSTVRFHPPPVPTGCNEFVFIRSGW